MVGKGYLDAVFGGLGHRWVFGIKPEKEYALTPGLSIIVFQKSICTDIAVKNKDLGIRIFFLEMQCVFNSRLATDTGAVGVLLVARSDALNHNHLLGLIEFALFHPIGQLKLGHDPRVIPVQVFFGLIFVGPGGQNNHPVFYFALLHIRPDHDFGSKVAFKARITHHQCIGDHLNLLMGGHPGNQVAKVFSDIGALNGCRQSIRQAAQFGLFFNQGNLITLIGQAQSGIQAGNPAADHQAFLDNRDFLFL